MQSGDLDHLGERGIVRAILVCMVALFAVWGCYGLLPQSGLDNDLAFRVMDGVFITFTLCVIFTRPISDRFSYLIGAAVLIYVAADFIYLYWYNNMGYVGFSDGLIKDFIYSDKYFIYVAMMCVISQSNVISLSLPEALLKLLLPLMAVKYLYSHILGLANNRPVLLVENNYEQVFVIILYVIYTAKCRISNLRPEKWITGLLVFVVIASFSRSALAALVPALFLVNTSRSYKKLAFASLAFPFVVFAFYMVFSARESASGQIDRLIFFDVFWRELQQFSFTQYLFGVKPLTPLSWYSCERLNYYKLLFSSQDNGTCYALILHSYLFRSIHDHGLIGFIAPFGIILHLLKKTWLSPQERWAIIITAFLCGLSVSGIGTSFVALPIALACSIKRPSLKLGKPPKTNPMNGRNFFA